MDEGRFGLKTWLRKRWCPYKVRPAWTVQHRYVWRWLYAAVEPTTGQSFWLLLPGVDGVCLQLFLDQLADWISSQEPEPQRVGLVWDGSGAHRSGALVWPAELSPVALPAYAPELNPTEQVMRMIRGRLANQIFATLNELDAAILPILEEWWDEPERLSRLTAYPWWCNAVAAITPDSS